MNRRLKLGLGLALGAWALAACTPDTPQTAFSWDVNTSIAHPAPKRAAVASASKPVVRPQAQPGTGAVFAWPANGRVISEFGATDNGGRNDGINIAVPQGAPIRAAASGTVSYSGDELKDYGNLLLIKHDGGYVTAYAHADKLLVQRGDFVARGQVIAYAGHTGDVSTPQLHFEIRKGTVPVDPDLLLTQRSS